jgi:hypothetical protein
LWLLLRKQQEKTRESRKEKNQEKMSELLVFRFCFYMSSYKYKQVILNGQEKKGSKEKEIKSRNPTLEFFNY